MLSRLLLRPKAALIKRHCGFLASIGSSPSDLLTDPAVLDQATSKLQHRGPDGRHIATGRNGNLMWSMGHQRLAIVDPNSSSADMPFLLQFGQDKRVQLVANGEIYNHKTLYKELVDDHGWKEDRISHSDCEVIAHACACLGPEQAVTKLDGMFAFVLFQGNGDIFAARDRVGIKPLYKATDYNGNYVFSSELKALVGHVDASSVQAIPAGHYWTPKTGLVRYYQPDWLFDDNFAPWLYQEQPSDEEIRHAFTQAVQKRMMSDVEYGFLLSGGVDSCVLSHVLLPLYRKENDTPIPCFTVGMENSPDLMAAKAMVDALGGPQYVDHRPRIFTGNDVYDLIPKIIYHMETYEAELIRSAIPNWLLAERAGADVKMVLTGEGADEIFAGYLYFMDAETPEQVQNELKRIYQMLGDINLHRTDRMTMAHGLEARVPFLDTKFTELVMSLDPQLKVVDRNAVATNSVGREKTLLRNLFNLPNANGHSIPSPVLWRAKAMQCEGVGEDWVSQLQQRVSATISDADLEYAQIEYDINPPHTKEELYYRRIFESHFDGMAHVVNAWEGGCRAAGAAWESGSYTRQGLVNPNVLRHAFQTTNGAAAVAVAGGVRAFSTLPSQAPLLDEALQRALDSGYDSFEAFLTSGGDDRCLISPATGKNKYHIQPRPMADGAIFRGSCTCNAPTERGYRAAQQAFAEISQSHNVNDTLRTMFGEQRRRIAESLELPDGTEVVLCPSGSDAEYIPIAIARALGASNRIVNVVTQVKEIGAGSSVAAQGKYFSTHAPLTGRLPKGEHQLAGFDNVTCVNIPARERDGSVLDAAALVAEFVRQAEEDGAFPIVHGVFGGKTGLRDGTMPGSKDSGRSSLGVVDACQGRFALEELNEWLEQDSITLFTASKFYQAPPFCGAVLVPKRIAEQVRDLPVPKPIAMFSSSGLGGFLTDKELPDCMDSWRPLLSNNTDIEGNVGLALRWEAGLAEMEALSSVPDTIRTQACDEWATRVADSVHVEDELDAWCVERSIVSIRVRRSDDSGWLNMKELRDVYRYMSMDLSSAVTERASAEENAALSVVCNLGQPVDVAEPHAILRIALGSESLESYLNDPALTLQQDAAAVKKLAVIAKHFEALQQRGI